MFKETVDIRRSMKPKFPCIRETSIYKGVSLGIRKRGITLKCLETVTSGKGMNLNLHDNSVLFTMLFMVPSITNPLPANLLLSLDGDGI